MADSHRLGEPLAGMLADFCEANLSCSAIAVIRAAVKELIERDLAANAGLRRDYEAVRARRRGQVRLVVDNLLPIVVDPAMPPDQVDIIDGAGVRHSIVNIAVDKPGGGA